MDRRLRAHAQCRPRAVDAQEVRARTQPGIPPPLRRSACPRRAHVESGVLWPRRGGESAAGDPARSDRRRRAEHQRRIRGDRQRRPEPCGPVPVDHPRRQPRLAAVAGRHRGGSRWRADRALRLGHEYRVQRLLGAPDSGLGQLHHCARHPHQVRVHRRRRLPARHPRQRAGVEGLPVPGVHRPGAWIPAHRIGQVRPPW